MAEAASVGPLCLLARGLAGAGERGRDAPAVLIDGGRILAVGRKALQADAPRRELPGLWLSPAPLDTHVHLHLGGSPAENLAASREAGLAAVRDLGHGPDLDIPHGLAGQAPLVVVSGPGLGASGPGSCWLAAKLSGPQAFAQAVRQRLEVGTGVIKLFASGLLDFESPGLVQHQEAINSAEMKAAVEAAHVAGLLVAVHASGEATVKQALACGVDCIEHGFFLSDDTLAAMADHCVTWSPTLAPVLSHARDPQGRYDEATRKRLREIARMQGAQLKRGAELGVRLLLGSDAGAYGLTHGKAAFAEMAAWLDAGVAPETVFKAATGRAAKVLGLSEELGGIFPGARAWLLATAGDPSQDPLLLASPAWRSF